MFSRTPNTLGIRNNNPFNIRYYAVNNWYGLVGSNKGFCVFLNMEYGMRAGIILLRNYIRKKNPVYGRCNTIAKIVNRFAPTTENDTERYIRYLCNNLDIDRNTEIVYPSGVFARLCVSVCFYESQYQVPEDYIYIIINQFKLY